MSAIFALHNAENCPYLSYNEEDASVSKESAVKFVQAIMEDEELRARTENTKPEDAVPFAKEMGYDCTLEELTEAMNEARELSLDDLNAVVGGCLPMGHGMPKDEQKEAQATHCRGDKNGFMHVFVLTGHVEERYWFGSTRGYNIYKCKLCKHEKKVRT